MPCLCQLFTGLTGSSAKSKGAASANKGKCAGGKCVNKKSGAGAVAKSKKAEAEEEDAAPPKKRARSGFDYDVSLFEFVCSAWWVSGV